MLIEMGKKSKLASRALAVSDNSRRNAALYGMADAIMAHAEEIIAENAKDLEHGRQTGMTSALLDRLRLDQSRLEGMARGLRDVAALPDPLGRLLWETTRPNGLLIQRIAVPIGVIAVIYEARPNVTADSAALCLKSGNAVILRGGKEAIFSNTILARVMSRACADAGLPGDCVALVPDTSRESADQLMKLNGYVDVLIPRGGKGLIDSVLRNATVPVIETGAGTCHTYVDSNADIVMAASIIDNAKTSRPSVCNACECMLIHKDIAEAALPVIAGALFAKHTEIHGDSRVCALVPGAIPAVQEDWGKEYSDYIIAAKVVDSMDEALAHILRYGTGHSECIVTEDPEAAERFLGEVDAAAVYHNASTRFTDGGEFGFGAEIGISTQKLHVRGPIGLKELTSMKYKIYGAGQIR
jgi:glutamate-5-semialdehyde dehydrogenase